LDRRDSVVARQVSCKGPLLAAQRIAAAFGIPITEPDIEDVQTLV
jgi:hypothetical protein